MANLEQMPVQASNLALILLQVAASQAQIGPFARRACETPQIGARLYREAAQRR